MSQVYKTIELTGTSATSTDEAIRSAIAKAAETVRNLQWFEVVETRGRIAGNRVEEWQVTVKIGFAIEE